MHRKFKASLFMLSEDRKLLLAIANNLSLVKFVNIADHRTSD
jgi:hypothetical protein